MQYTIAAVSPQTRDYSTKFGDMRSYKVRFQETGETVVEISQKVTTSPPQVGQPLEGTIDMSGQYGPKFKKEYGQGGGFGSTSSGQASTSAGSASPTPKSGFQNDPFTMYLSYAKDIAVALIAAGTFTKAKYEDALEKVVEGGNTLYDARPGAEPKDSTKDVLPDDDEVDTTTLDTIFPEATKSKGDDVIDVSEVPF